MAHPTVERRWRSRQGRRCARTFRSRQGVLINLSIGILYAWSVFVAPLEAELGADRATVSGAQSLCLFTATIGCFVMHRLLHWLTLPQLTLVMGAVTAVGLALAGYGQSVAALYVGYGVLYGFGAGILYFVAMTAASIDGPVRPSIAMSINMSAVAAGGIAWSPGLAFVIDGVGPATAFGMAAAVVLAAAAISAALIAFSGKEAPATGAIGLFQDMLTDRPRVVIVIFLGFLCVAFTALAIIGHAATMMAAWGASAGETQFAPMLSSAGYVAGALVGGLLTDALTGRRVLVGVGLVMGVFLLALYVAPGVVMGLVAIGCGRHGLRRARERASRDHRELLRRRRAAAGLRPHRACLRPRRPARAVRRRRDLRCRSALRHGGHPDRRSRVRWCGVFYAALPAPGAARRLGEAGGVRVGGARAA